MKDYIYERFDPAFLKEETRCGYTIPEKQKKLWAIELDLLNQLLAVCKKYDLKVYAYAGTMLGAVRHKGFIPWDDDMDLFLLREDFNKLVEVGPKEFKEPYFLQNAYSDKEFFIGYCRLRNSDSTGILKWERSENYNNGVYIDIFVMDAFINDREKIRKQKKMTKFYAALAGHYYAGTQMRNTKQKILLSLYKNTFCKLVPYETVLKWYEANLRKYEGQTTRYGMLTHDDSFVNNFDIKDIKEVVMMDYENTKIPVPSGYDNMLKTQYGDYMQFPPVEERGIWHGDNITYDPDTPYKEYIRTHS